MSFKSRLLGLAFASADVLIELDADRRIAFAMGAGPAAGLDPGAAWSGRPIAELLDPADAARLGDALKTLAPGARSEPVEVRILTSDGRSRRASIRAFVLPELAPAVSCALSWTEAVAGTARSQTPVPMLDARGLLKRLGDFFIQGGTGPEAAFAFVQVPGLEVQDEPHRRAAARIEARLQSASLDGGSAARLAPDRFAVMGDAGPLADLTEAIRAACAAEGLDLSPMVGAAELQAGVDPAIAVRTLRMALDACLKDGAAAGAFFNERLSRTVRDADRFRALVRDRDFNLVYQPIIDLKTGAVHHFEALARLAGATRAPTGPIQMAEELGLIEGFDVAVAEKALQQIQRPGSGLVKVAVNVSGASLMADGYVGALLRMTAAAPELRRRLMLEITETAAIADLDQAARRIAALREAGIRVALDDFGIGAITLDYLRRLRVDTVKLDGSLIRDLATDDRARTLAGHVVSLCADLKMTTVAEMIETGEQEAAVRALGVDQGQGWLFGRPTAEPVIPTAPSTARRIGEVSGWG